MTMDFDRISQILRDLTFRRAIWFFPFAFALHALEEWRQFTPWAMRYCLGPFYPGASTSPFTRPALSVAYPGVTYRWLIWVSFAFIFAPVVFFNTLFGAGVTICRVYCPGLLTALTVYPPLYYFLSPAGLS
jgi:hypothetical protein